MLAYTSPTFYDHSILFSTNRDLKTLNLLFQEEKKNIVELYLVDLLQIVVEIKLRL